MTKCDMVVLPDLARRHTLIKERLKIFKNGIDPPLMVSAKKGSGIVKLRFLILSIVGGLERAREVANRKKLFRFANVKSWRNSTSRDQQKKGPSYYVRLRKGLKNPSKNKRTDRKFKKTSKARKYK
ncbi:6764_t:CDS:1 [Diversispora eburnea]|uniref:6764_t:CDS:1 n=2 Tax=Diversisporales TaxID=214509 RepID=A0A9N9C1W6_9GLOM|nr:6764_t:CDS:1 [Diversispora eburnea]